MAAIQIPKVVFTAAAWALVTVAVGLLALSVAPRLVGGKSFAVLSNSMRGSVETGDQVIVMPHRATEIQVGEIVAFSDPEGSGRLFQHRVQRVELRGGRIEVITMGDANSGWERWSLSASESIGRVVAVLPYAGYIFGPVGRPVIRGLLATISWLSILCLILLTIWRPASPVKEAPTP